MDELLSDLRKIIEPMHALIDDAVTFIEPDVYDILIKRITDERRHK